VVTVVIILGLVLVNGLFVAAEFAIVATPPTSIDRLAQRGSRTARHVSRILHEPRLQDRYIATAQLGISAASLALGMYGEKKVATWIANLIGENALPTWLAAHAVGSAIAVITLTYLHIVLGEMVPKAVALIRAERTVLWVSPIIGAFELIGYPVVIALNGIGNGLLRILGVSRRREGHEHYLTTKELKYIVRESEESGLIRTESADVLERLFEFGRLTAREVMVPRVKIVGIEVGTSLEELVALLEATPHTRYPVFAHDLDHIVGTVHIKDLLPRVRSGKTLHPTDVRMIPFVPQSTPLNKVLESMRQRRAQMVVVMDEHGGTAGIITIEDLFSEIVGDIDDWRPRAREIEEHGQALEVAGTARVQEVGEYLGRNLRHDEVDTISGLVLALLERPPRVSDVVEYDGVRFEVLAIEGHGVTKCRVTDGSDRPA
jgi:CBS domain containing-hemolysin-like protein